MPGHCQRNWPDFASKIMPLSPRPDLTRRRKLKNDILIELVFAKWRLKLRDIRRDPPRLIARGVAVKNGLAGSCHDGGRHPGEFAFNAAPIKGARLSLGIVRTMPKAVNQPRVTKN